MRKYILTASFALLALLVAGILVWMVQFSDQSSTAIAGYEKSEKQPVSSTSTGESWVSKMAHVTTREYHFPVNELFIKLQPQEAAPPKTQVYQLVVEQSDRYSHFCIVQTLDSFAFAYTLTKDKSENKVYIQAQNRQYLDAVVEKLKEYSIQSTVKEAWL
jgi:hypothetical protein